MARRANRAGGRSTARASARSTSSRKARPAAADGAAEPTQGGLDFEAGIGIVTAIVLIAAMLVLDYSMGAHYEGGFFFK